MADAPSENFINAFNEELDRLGCGVKVRRRGGPDHEEMLEIVDLDGMPVDIMPDTVRPNGMAAFMLIVEMAFEEGVAVGRGVSGRLTPHRYL